MAFNPTEFSRPDFDTWFASYRYKQDDYADDVAIEIVKSPHYAEVFAEWAKIQNNNDKVNFQIPKAAGSGYSPCLLCLSDEKHNLLNEKLNTYFRSTAVADFMNKHIETVKRGCEFFNIYNASATLALVTRSLLKQYAAYNATNVLMFTKMIKDAPNRRILESMRFVRDVMAIDGYDPGGRGVRNIQKLRLVHAVIRARINSGKYDRLQYIKDISAYVAKVATSVNVKEAQSDATGLAQIATRLTNLSKYLNDKVTEIENFNKARKDKNNPRNISQRADDLQRSINYLLEVQKKIYDEAQIIEEDARPYNEITFLIDKDVDTTLPHLVNDLERYAKQIEWNEQEWGLPINQQDMIFAIHTFSVEVIDGLIASGEDLKPEEIEDYYLTWHYIGHCLGVLDEINPDKYETGKKMQQLIYKKEFTEYNPNGDALSLPLLRFLKSILPFNSGPQVRAVIANYNDKEDFQIFKYNLKIDMDDIDEFNLFRLKRATMLLRIVVAIRQLFRSRDPKYRYSSFILKHLGIVDQLDSTLSPAARNNAFGAAFSGTDAEGEFKAETEKEKKSFPLIVIKSILSKIGKDIKKLFSGKK